MSSIRPSGIFSFGGGFILAIFVLGALLPSSSSQAQPGAGRGPRLAPEKQEAAWTMEAKCVADDLKLPADSAAKMADAYKSSRKNFQEASRKMMQDAQGDRMSAMQGMLDLRTSETLRLQNVLKGCLNEEQAKSAMASLGSFNPQWDLMVDALADFKLDEKKGAEALKRVKTYVEGAAKAQNDAMDTMDFQSLREEIGKLKQKLDEDLSAILSPDQVTEWKTKAAAGRRRRGPEGGAASGSNSPPGTESDHPAPPKSKP
ncbi:hypothetical protein HYR69_08940 [Candidatus Sumerlaeota bacterium]|nr:hypothetical protein [Candidatus Sumerlaeota bacterium]